MASKRDSDSRLAVVASGDHALTEPLRKIHRAHIANMRAKTLSDSAFVRLTRALREYETAKNAAEDAQAKFMDAIASVVDVNVSAALSLGIDGGRG